MVLCSLKLLSDGKQYPIYIDNELSVSKLKEVISVVMLLLLLNRFNMVFHRIYKVFIMRINQSLWKPGLCGNWGLNLIQNLIFVSIGKFHLFTYATTTRSIACIIPSVGLYLCFLKIYFQYVCPLFFNLEMLWRWIAIANEGNDPFEL